MQDNNSLQSVIRELEDLFEVLNSTYFESELSKPVITVSPDSKNHSLGWCTTYKAWQNKEDGEGYYEINICAEHLARPFEEVAGTMLHEMVHLWNLHKGIKDTSRAGTYHNAKFKKSAEEHGLIVENTEKYGWAKTELDESTKAEVTEFMSFIGKDSFDIYRQAEKEEKKKGGRSSSRKYVCPGCGSIIRATKEVKVVCGECSEDDNWIFYIEEL